VPRQEIGRSAPPQPCCTPRPAAVRNEPSRSPRSPRAFPDSNPAALPGERARGDTNRERCRNQTTTLLAASSRKRKGMSRR
jgi:hypothetical protein